MPSKLEFPFSWAFPHSLAVTHSMLELTFPPHRIRRPGCAHFVGCAIWLERMSPANCRWEVMWDGLISVFTRHSKVECGENIRAPVLCSWKKGASSLSLGSSMEAGRTFSGAWPGPTVTCVSLLRRRVRRGPMPWVVSADSLLVRLTDSEGGASPAWGPGDPPRRRLSGQLGLRYSPGTD